MKQISAAALALLLTLPAGARAEEHNMRDGFDFLNEGSRRLLEGLMDEMRPMFEDHMLPMLAELSELIDDITLYEMPEILPNGDIIIRRRVPLEENEVEEGPVEDPIDL